MIKSEINLGLLVMVLGLVQFFFYNIQVVFLSWGWHKKSCIVVWIEIKNTWMLNYLWCFNAPLNNTSVVLWLSAFLFLVKDTGGTQWIKPRPVTCDWQSLSHHAVWSSSPETDNKLTALSMIDTDCIIWRKFKYHIHSISRAPGKMPV